MSDTKSLHDQAIEHEQKIQETEQAISKLQDERARIESEIDTLNSVWWGHYYALQGVRKALIAERPRETVIIDNERVQRAAAALKFARESE